eukprot:TRINITY_DN6669_c0_g1_i1.p1 TRINITY_DN6669_c0_g1~~TRINITY_DN6669_c0_g1_i1.p1  ORF type:complete len:125 (+),score=26.63 TRINITY_DN6669_c0_g1_i1:28-375(+)
MELDHSSEEKTEQQNHEQEFFQELENYTPTIPVELTDFYLRRSGYICPDKKVTKLVSLATQKFLTDIIHDSMQYCKQHNQSVKGKAQFVLTMDDLSRALGDYGINVNKPPYHTNR